MLVVVVTIFAISWLPLYCIFARIKFGGKQTPAEEHIFAIVTPVAQWMGASNSSINPMLYAFFNKKYRRGFMAIIKSRNCCGKLQYNDYPYQHSSTMKTSLYYSIKKSFSSQKKSLSNSEKRDSLIHADSLKRGSITTAMLGGGQKNSIPQRKISLPSSNITCHISNQNNKGIPKSITCQPVTASSTISAHVASQSSTIVSHVTPHRNMLFKTPKNTAV